MGWRPDFWFPVGIRYFFFKCLVVLWDPPSLLFNGYRLNSCGASGRGVTSTVRLHLAPRLRMSEAITPQCFNDVGRGKFSFYMLFFNVLWVALALNFFKNFNCTSKLNTSLAFLNCVSAELAGIWVTYTYHVMFASFSAFGSTLCQLWNMKCVFVTYGRFLRHQILTGLNRLLHNSKHMTTYRQPVPFHYFLENMK